MLPNYEERFRESMTDGQGGISNIVTRAGDNPNNPKAPPPLIIEALEWSDLATLLAWLESTIL